MLNRQTQSELAQYMLWPLPKLFIVGVTLFITVLQFSQLTHANTDGYNIESIELLLQESESRFEDIVAGTEKTITWHAAERQKTALSIVYVHGFSATHKELSPMTELLAKQLQANVFYTRLRGHGRSDDAMAEATVDDWKENIIEAYQIGSILGDNVLLIGTSTGATLTTWLSAQPEVDKVMANVMISPNFGIKRSGAWILQWSIGRWLIKQFNGEYRGFTPQNDFHARYWTERYPLDAMVPMLDLVDEVADLDKSAINIPQLIVYSPKDQVIDVDKALETAKEFSSAKVKTVAFTTSTEPGQHVLVGKGSTISGDYQEQVDKMLNLLVSYVEELQTK